ncbi:hypothetical protein L204_106300 [Cryptococcus depauperatus]
MSDQTTRARPLTPPSQDLMPTIARRMSSSLKQALGKHNSPFERQQSQDAPRASDKANKQKSKGNASTPPISIPSPTKVSLPPPPLTARPTFISFGNNIETAFSSAVDKPRNKPARTPYPSNTVEEEKKEPVFILPSQSESLVSVLADPFVLPLTGSVLLRANEPLPLGRDVDKNSLEEMGLNKLTPIDSSK